MEKISTSWVFLEFSNKYLGSTYKATIWGGRMLIIEINCANIAETYLGLYRATRWRGKTGRSGGSCPARTELLTRWSSCTPRTSCSPASSCSPGTSCSPATVFAEPIQAHWDTFLKTTAAQVWKARVNGYEEATKLFQQWDEDDPKWKGISLKLCKKLIILMTVTAEVW